MLRPLYKFFLASLIFAAIFANVATALTNTSPKKDAQPSDQLQHKSDNSEGDKPAIPTPPTAEDTATTTATGTATVQPKAAGEKMRVMVIGMREPIDEPVLYVLRRGLKEAEEKNYDVVIIDMKTPGGSVGVTLDIIEALAKFKGTTCTFINDEAISAGALVAAGTHEIWLAPHAVIGASAAVNSDGQDIGETMRLKITSFLRGKVRAITENNGYRGPVIEAMIDKDFELKIDGIVIKAKGSLLSLTATEAMKTYGTPARPLLGAGIAKSVEDLLHQKFGAANFEITHLDVTWSERLAKWLSMIKPILIGLGMLALFIEFKTPGFGFFGIAGIVLLVVVFLSSYVAGLSGHEPLLIFALGLILIILELIFFPGVMLPIVTGLVLMLASLVWAMADVWPSDPISVTWTSDALTKPIFNLGAGLLIAVVLIIALLRFLPKTWFWNRIELASEISGSAQVAGIAPDEASILETLIGKTGRVITPLRPFGQVEVDGKRYEAQLPFGSADSNTTIIVRGHTDFALNVDAVAPEKPSSNQENQA